MTRPTSNFNAIGGSRQVLDGLCMLLERQVPLTFPATRIRPQTAWQVLVDASLHQTSVEASCQRLAAAPSGNRLREVLLPALPACAQLEEALNALLQAQLPRVLCKPKHRLCLAADITLIPYHGQPQTDVCEVMRAQAKCGTNQFHGYATVAVVHQRQRWVLAVHFVRLHESMDAILSALLTHVNALHIRVRRLYVDKEFYSVAVLRWLHAQHLDFVLPVPLRAGSREAQRICRGRGSHWAYYTLHSEQHGSYTVRVAAVKRQRRPGQRKVIRWFIYALAGLSWRMPPQQVFQLYRQRFSIESGYRQMNQLRARTSSRDPVFRLLLVGLALLLVNLYLQLRQVWRSRRSHARARRRTWLTLKRLVAWLRPVLEALLGLKPLVQLRPLPSFS